MRLLLDEHLSRQIAARLRELGHNAVAVTERTDLRSLPDDLLLAAAAAEGRSIVTFNIRDFPGLAAALADTGTRHAGVILVSPDAFSPSPRGMTRLTDALQDLGSSEEGNAIVDGVVWLQPPPEVSGS